MTRITNKPRRSGYVTVILDCNHTTEISCKSLDLGQFGNTQRCVFCGLQMIKRILRSEWHYRCNNCRHQYWGGIDQAGTYRKRDEHRAKYPTHLMSAVVFDKVTADNKGTFFRVKKRWVR